jgi:CHASE2 domain-containing sensor protein
MVGTQYTLPHGFNGLFEEDEMIDPGFPTFISALLVFAWGLYYLFINKRVKKKWPMAITYLLYIAFAVSCLVIIWGVVYILVTRVVSKI